MTNLVYALTVYNGELIAGGSFTTAGGVSAAQIARWNGSLWQPMGTGIGDVPIALTVYNVGLIGQLVAGGAFGMAGDHVSVAWARWGPICAPGDLDQDGVVGGLDFRSLLGAWGACPQPRPPSCAADLDGDCQVGIVDFLMLLANWG